MTHHLEIWTNATMKRTVQLGIILAMFGISGNAFADSAGVVFSEGQKFTEKTGEAIYSNLCQACHMDKGQGAVGAGRYPALAKNENFEEASYPIFVITHGQKAMPPVGEMLSDDQIAAVVNYVRTHFGNNYKDDPATAEAVKESRP